MFIKKFLHRLHESGDWKVILFHSSWAFTLTSGLSYFFGLLRDRIFAHTFGLSRTLDIYNASFVIPDLLLTVLVGTALSAAFLPIFTKLYDEKKSLGFAYAHQMMSWAILILGVIGIVAAITLPYYAQKLVPGFEGADLEQYILLTRIMLFSPFLFAISNIYGRILMSGKDFLWYGISPALYNVGIILGALFLVPYFGLVGLVLGTIVGVMMHLGIRLMMVKQPKYNFRHKFSLAFSPEIKETVKLMAPKMVQYLMWSIMLLSFTAIASELAEGSVAAYNYARNFQSLPVSMLGIAIAMALFTSLSHDAGKGNFEKFKKDLRRDRLRSLTYTTLAAIALAILAKPAISILLGGGQFDESDVRLLTITLQVYCISIPLESMLHIYHRSFYALRNTIIPATFHALAILGMIVLAKNLAPQMGVLAIPVSFAVGVGIHVTILATIFPFLLRRREKSFTS
jgi:putative peptidoglycan lipid II flippase